jgi:hypothetical protein
MEMLISISISIMAIFSAELGCRRPPSNQDILYELRRNLEGVGEVWVGW